MLTALYILAGLIVGLAGGFFAGSSQATSRAREIDEQTRIDAEKRAERLIAEAEKDAEAKREYAERDAEARRKEAEADARQRREEAERDAAAKRADADREAANKRSEAQREAATLLERANREHETFAAEKKSELERMETRLQAREDKLDSRAVELDRKQSRFADDDKQLQARAQKLDQAQADLKDKERQLAEQLEQIAGMSAEEAKQSLIDQMLAQARHDAEKEARQIERIAIEEADIKAKKVLAVAVQRYAGNYVVERCAVKIKLKNAGEKGRIIGVQGRNINALIDATGVEVSVDNQLLEVTFATFDPVRREVARLSIERLLATNNINPRAIEKTVGAVRAEITSIIEDAGKRAVHELGLVGLHPEIVTTMGKLRYRTSYGQNIWAHSIEVGFLCGALAGEMGLDVRLAKRAGFLHDIGKAMTHDTEGPHAIIGAKFCKDRGESDLIVNAIEAHHNEVPQESVYAHLVMAADAISGARPGARSDTVESYINRLADLERISSSFEGVNRAFAFQAGREVRVFVENKKISDDQVSTLSRNIAESIQSQLRYPGQIKVTVIRETRASAIAT